MLKGFSKIFLAFFALPIFWQLSKHCQWVQSLENYTLYLRYFLRGSINEEKLAESSKKELPNIVCVNIDNSSLKLMGEQPIPMSYYTKAMYAIQKYAEPAVIATNIFFGEKQYSTLIDPHKVQIDEQACYYYFSRLKNTIVGGWFNCNGKGSQTFLRNEYPLPLIKQGFVDFLRIKDPILPSTKIVSDNVLIGLNNVSASTNYEEDVRWLPLYARTQNGIFYGLSVEALHLYLNNSGNLDIRGDDASSETYQGKHTILFLDKDISVVKQIPLTQRQLLEINWFSSWKKSSTKKVNLENVLKHCDILDSKEILSSEKLESYEFFKQFNQSIVFLSNAIEETNLIKTLIDTEKTPSISAHINAFKTMYWDAYIQHLPVWGEFLILFVLNFFIASLTLYPEIFSKCMRLFFCCIIMYFLLAFYLFGVCSLKLHIALPIIAPLGSILTFWGLGTVYQLLVERTQRLRLKRVFGNYLSPEIVATMLKQQNDPQLGGVERNLTAFFSDIQSFSTFSELLDPISLVALMNEYLTEVTNTIINDGGTLDKYIGDAVVAMFGAPFPLENHPLKACVAACKIQEKQVILREKWAREHSNWPEEVFRMRTRIGLCSGNAIVGNMGSETRFNFTMMGDTVNIGARCESGAKTYGVYTLVSEDTYKEVIAISNQLVFRFIDRIVVKGRQHPLGVYELVGLKNNLSQSSFDCIELFEKGIHNYLSRNWTEAIQCFEKSATMEPFIPGRDPGIFTNPSIVFINRCQYMQQYPPSDDWEGVFVMKTK